MMRQERVEQSKRTITGKVRNTTGGTSCNYPYGRTRYNFQFWGILT